MQLSKWMKKVNSEEIRKLAKKVDCHPNYLYQVAKNGCSAGLAKKIKKWTTKLTPDCVVTRHDLRPDIWKKGE